MQLFKLQGGLKELNVMKHLWPFLSGDDLQIALTKQLLPRTLLGGFP